MKQILASLLFALVFTGCASKQRFGYPISAAPSGSVAGRTVEVLPISDTRTNRFIDRHFITNLLADVQEMVGKELESTGQFQSQKTLAGTSASERTNGNSGERRLSTELRRVQWEVPNYDAILGKTFLYSLFTGGIGGVIYISTSTQVNGFVVVHLELAEARGGRVLLAKEYPGFYTEKMAKASCDTSTTKRRMTTEAFKDAMTQFKADLKRVPAGGTTRLILRGTANLAVREVKGS